MSNNKSNNTNSALLASTLLATAAGTLNNSAPVVEDETSNNSAPVVKTDAELKVDYNDYKLECAAEGKKPKTFHQWKNAGKIFFAPIAPTVTIATTPTAAAGTTSAPAKDALAKSDIARRILARHIATGILSRKAVITDFCSDPLFAENGLVPLSPAGAATYYANETARYKKDPAGFMRTHHVPVEVVEVEPKVEPEAANALEQSMTPAANVDEAFDAGKFGNDEQAAA